MTMKYLGIDGCKAGWLLVRLSADGALSFNVLSSIDSLLEYLDDAACALVDIPIGLRSRHPDERVCDRMARAVLKQRRASVFAAPSRCALDCDDYAEANARNRECTGRGLSKQSFNILPKIREVDRFLQGNPQCGLIHEMHPEVCFWALNQRQAMQYPKRSEAGFVERMDLLCRYLPDADDLVEQAIRQYPRRQLARDDVVDALVGALTASKIDQWCRFPEVPEFDELGLPMEVVYWLP